MYVTGRTATWIIYIIGTLVQHQQSFSHAVYTCVHIMPVPSVRDLVFLQIVMA